jgi:hypothetical protein
VGWSGLFRMPKYHLYFLEKRCVVAAEDIEASDNVTAIRAARRRADGRVVEVWNAHSLLKTVVPDDGDMLQPSRAIHLVR